MYHLVGVGGEDVVTAQQVGRARLRCAVAISEANTAPSTTRFLPASADRPSRMRRTLASVSAHGSATRAWAGRLLIAVEKSSVEQPVVAQT